MVCDGQRAGAADEEVALIDEGVIVADRQLLDHGSAVDSTLQHGAQGAGRGGGFPPVAVCGQAVQAVGACAHRGCKEIALQPALVRGGVEGKFGRKLGGHVFGCPWRAVKRGDGLALIRNRKVRKHAAARDKAKADAVGGGGSGHGSPLFC